MTDTAVNAGDVAAKNVERWRWWQTALADPSEIGKSLGVHDGDAQQGYYRTRSKGGPWEPVAIYYPESSDDLVAYRNGQEVRPDAIWTWCCRNPISYEAYQQAMAGKGFDDEPPAPTVGHNSGDDDPFEAIRQELSGEAEMAAEFLGSEIKTQADADKAGIWAKRLSDLSKRADNHRVVEKEPHLIASRAVDDKWRDPIAQAKEWAAKLKKHVEPFLIAQRRAEEVRQRKAREEAEAARRAAAEAARKAQESEGNDAEAARESERLAAQAKQAEQEAEARRVNAGRTGARVSVRVEKVGVVTDYAKAAAALVAMNHKDLIETIDKLAQRAAKAGMPFDGMEVQEQERVV